MENEEHIIPLPMIIPLNHKRCFTEADANQLIDLLLTITRNSKSKMAALQSQLECSQSDPDKMKEIQDRINDEVRVWSNKINRLGMSPLSLWKVKFHSEDKTPWVWEFPNDAVTLID